jgi:hypothetical protein
MEDGCGHGEMSINDTMLPTPTAREISLGDVIFNLDDGEAECSAVPVSVVSGYSVSL